MLREMLTYRASLPRGLGAVRQARRALIDFAAQCGFDNGVLDDVESAVGEALANAAEHGDCAQGIDIMATFDQSRLVIEVKDHGVGFDCGAALERASAPDANGNRGFGIFLMRTLMDEVAYSDCGSRIQLVKRLGARASVSAL
jgi:anti-sigma regulatory factor (Ser/Thr protein kinase)